MTKETIEIGGEPFEVPQSWAQELRDFARQEGPRGQQVQVFTVNSPTPINTAFFGGIFCNTVKVDPPPVIKETTTATGAQIIRILTIGGPCSGRARSELLTLIPKSVGVTEETHYFKS